MIEYKIEGGNLPVVICSPEAGQTLCTEKGSMRALRLTWAITK